jgi:hypothetical protein
MFPPRGRLVSLGGQLPPLGREREGATVKKSLRIKKYMQRCPRAPNGKHVPLTTTETAKCLTRQVTHCKLCGRHLIWEGGKRVAVIPEVVELNVGSTGSTR